MWPKFSNNEEEPRMISAEEAKELTRKAKFAKSAYPHLVDTAIREACENGEDTAEILIPLDVVPDMVTFLCDHGFEEVVVTGAITGAVVAIAW